MNTPLNQLVQLLRNELLHHGELLALLDRQPAHNSPCRIEDLLPATQKLEAQCQALQQSRQLRIEWQADLAERAGLDRQMTLPKLIPHLPRAYGPLLEALVEEIEAARRRIQTRLQQNHHALGRGVEVMLRLLDTLSPTAAGRLNTDRLDCCIAGSNPAILDLQPLS